MTPPLAVLFDVDGTLVDSVDLHAQAWHAALARFGKHVHLEDVRGQIGKGGDQLLPVFLSAYELSRHGKELEGYRSELWRREYAPRVRPFPGARDLLLRVRQDGKRIALASSAKGDELDASLRLLGVDRAILEGATTSDDADRSKPAPDIFEAALARAGAPAEAALAVGDSPWDAISARRAGLRTIGVLSGGFPEEDLRDAGCVAIYRDPADLLARYAESPFARGT